MTYTQLSRRCPELLTNNRNDDFVIEREGCVELVIDIHDFTRMTGSRWAFKAHVWASETDVLKDYADVFKMMAKLPEKITPDGFRERLEKLGYTELPK